MSDSTHWTIPDVFLINKDIRNAFPFLIPMGIVGLWRWFLYALRIVLWLLYRPVQPKTNEDGSSANKFKSSDVTVIVPTIDTGDEFFEAAKYWRINLPHEVIVVTTDEMKDELTKICNGIDQDLFRVLSVPMANKRVQLCAGVNAASTPIVALSDDDAVWTIEFLAWCLAPFDDDKTGGVGSKQVMVPVEGHPSFWEVVADFRLTMRMIEASATTFVDGGMSCISGRTAVYRTDIVKDARFQKDFQNETWLGKYHLHSGDDKFITRWLVRNGWKMQLQNHKDCCLQTTFKNNSKFLNQVLRWTRNTWRSDIKSIFLEHKIIWRYPYVFFNMFDKFINPFPMLWGITVIIGNLVTNVSEAVTYVLIPVAGWLLLTRTLRLVPHLIHKPSHIPYIPSMILFQYYFVFAKIYALITLHITDWGSRPTAGSENVEEVLDETAQPTNAVHKRTSQATFHGGSSLLNLASLDIEEQESSSSSVKKKIVPWYCRRSFIMGCLVLGAMIASLVVLGVISAQHNKSYWTMTEVTNTKSLTADRATGVGLYDADSGKTFLAYAGPNMDPHVMEFDHAIGEYVNHDRIAFAHPNSDFHDYPRIIMADDEHLVVVYTFSPAYLYIAKAPNPHSSFGEWDGRIISKDRSSYPCLIKSDSGSLYVFYRSKRDVTDYRPIHYTKSVDHGETWSDPQPAIDSGGFKMNQDPNNLNEIYFECPRREPATALHAERFSMGWTKSGGGPEGIIHNNYHKDAHFNYFYTDTDTFESVDGTNLGPTIDFDEFDHTLMFDSGPFDPSNKRIVDYYFSTSTLDKTEYPIVVFNFNRTLVSARWYGSKWQYSVVRNEAAYNTFDLEKLGPNEYRLFVAQTGVMVYMSYDGGVTWKREHLLTPIQGSVSKVIRIEDSHPDIAVIALENNWTEYNTFVNKSISLEGNFRVWALREVNLNPVRNPYYSSTSSTSDNEGLEVEQDFDFDDIWQDEPNTAFDKPEKIVVPAIAPSRIVFNLTAEPDFDSEDNHQDDANTAFGKAEENSSHTSAPSAVVLPNYAAPPAVLSETITEVWNDLKPEKEEDEEIEQDHSNRSLLASSWQTDVAHL